MRTLGIDYGKAKIGLAIGEGFFAEPLKVIRVNSFEDAIQKVLQVLQVEQVDKVVVGISEGQMGEESHKFLSELSQRLSAISNQQSTIVFDSFDETLSSQDAQRMSREAGIGRTKRREMEDAYAASIMLQNYLDSNTS